MIRYKMSNPRRHTRPIRTDTLAALMASAQCGDPEVIRYKASKLGKDLNFEYPGGRTLLTKAVEDNEALSNVEAIIKAGANVYFKNIQGHTALMVAIRARRPEVLKLLIESGADQDLVSHKNSSVFKQCLKEGLFSYLEILLKNVSGAVSICTKINEMALFIKRRGNKFTNKSRSQFEITDLTLKQGCIQAIKNGCRVNCTDETGTTPLMHAVKCHYDNCARLLLLAGADVNMINKKKETALIIAMTKAANPILPDLIMAGAFIKHPRSKTSSMHFEMFKKIIDYLQQNRLFNMKDIHGKTALIYAAGRGDRNCIMYAIEADIDEFVKIESLLERKNRYVSCVHVCDNAGLFSSICRCKEPEDSRCEDCDKYAREQMRKHKDKNGRPLLMYALETGRRLPDSYIQLRACDDACYRDEYGRTILMNFFKFYQQNTGLYFIHGFLCKAPPVLLETLSSPKHAFEISYKSIKNLFGGQVYIRDNEGNSTVIYAIKYYVYITEEIVELLVGDSQKEKYNNGKTALMLALLAYNVHAVRYIKPLIGDSCNIQDKEGKTALMYAITKQRGIPEPFIQQMIGDSQNVQDKEGKTALMYAMIRKGVISDNVIINMIGDSQNVQDNDGKTALMYALIHNVQLAEMIELLAGENPFIQDKSGRTALMYAFEFNRFLTYKNIKYLFGGKVNINDNEGNTTLIYAVQYNQFVTEDIIALLVGDSQKKQYEEGKTALMISLQCFNAPIGKHISIQNPFYLLSNSKKTLFMNTIRNLPYDLRKEVIKIHQANYLTCNFLKPLIGDTCNIQDKDGKTALMYAMINTRDIPDNIIKQMIGDSQNIQDKDGKTALMYAFIHQVQLSEEMIEHLAGENPLIQDTSGRTSLMYAFKFNRRLEYKTINELFQGKVNLRDNKGNTSVIYALKYCTYINEEIANLLVGDTQKTQYKDGKTALMIALKKDKLSCGTYHFVKPLIGNSCNVQDTEGKTALMYVMKHKRDFPNHLLKMMISESQYIRDKEGKTALMHASQCFNFSNILRIELFNRDILNVQDKFGKTALHHAIEHDQDDEYLEDLILHGADLEMEDNYGRTALILCLEIETQENVYFNGWTEYFLKTKMLLQNNPILRLNLKGKSFLINSIETGMFSLMDLHKNKEIFRLMIANGVFRFPHPRSGFSALFQALEHNLLDVAKYVIANVCLTSDDLKMLNNAKPFLKSSYSARNPSSDFNYNNLDLSSRDLQHLVIDATYQPWPLVKLSFIAVNSAVSHCVDREHRINMLPLPNPIKDMLMFNTRTALLPVSEWANIPMVFDPVEYEKTSRPRPLLNYWPFGDVLVV